MMNETLSYLEKRKVCLFLQLVVVLLLLLVTLSIISNIVYY